MQNLAAKFFKLLLTILFFTISLFTFHFSLFPTAAQAAESPNPQPCQNPIVPNAETLTDNWLADKDKKPPQELQLTVASTGPPSAPVTASVNVPFTNNFSQISALFAPENSNYLEGKYQDEEHKEANVLGFTKADFNNFHGAAEKAAPQVMLDQMRVKYVVYVSSHGTLAEAGDEFADINGQNPKTIYDMVTTPGFDNPPNPPSLGGDKSKWEATWGKYWDKIPTAYSEFYQAYIVFRTQHKQPLIAEALAGKRCPYLLDRTINFVMPEFFRTTSISSQLNQVVVPIEAQACHAQDDRLRPNNPRCNNQAQTDNGILAKIISACLKVFTENPVSNALKKVIKTSQNLFLAKPVLAADPPDCIRVLVGGKQGQDPYCALPADQLQSGESCTNQNDQYKLNEDNPNVICTFIIHWERGMVLSAGPAENQFDECHPNGDGTVTCTMALDIWPIFRIPFQTEIWNNTLYSDNKNNEPFIGSADFQRKGQPGVYSAFTPKVINETKLESILQGCDTSGIDPTNLDAVRTLINSSGCKNVLQLAERLATCHPDQDPNSEGCQELASLGVAKVDVTTFTTCANNVIGGGLISSPPELVQLGLIGCAISHLKALESYVKRPGQSQANDTPDDLKRRFIGGTDCSKEFVRDVALKPIALQQALGVTTKCKLAAAQQPPSNPPPSGGQPPDGTPPNHNNCNGHYGLNNPLGNFGDPNCTLLSSRSLVAQQIAFTVTDETTLRNWIAIIEMESSFNANNYNANSTAGQAFGLFQMGHAQYDQYGLPYQIADGGPGGNEYDRGDVEWPIQISNALHYNDWYYQQTGGSFCYWGAAIRLGIAQGC